MEKARSKYQTLGDAGYYSKDGKQLAVRLSYVELAPEITVMADEAAKALEAVGIKVEKTAISQEDLQTIVKEGKKDYDLLLTGVNL